MRGVLLSIVIAAGLVGCGPEQLASARAPLTTTDVDVAPECQGVITFVNAASYDTLHLYVPSNVANNIIAARPMVTLADLSAVNQVAATRLTQLYQGALAQGYVTSSCVGIYDELAVSSDDQAQLVSLVNTISDEEMHDILPYAWNGAVNLLGSRPLSSVAGISNTYGIGEVSLRNLRNAATLSKPLEALGTAVTNLHREVRLYRHFNWYQEMNNALSGYHLSGVTCFGVDPDLLPNGSEIRPNLANAAEVYAAASNAVNYANRYHELQIDPSVGLANLQQVAAGKAFFGCYIGWAPDPWSGHTLSFFVDTTDGFGVLAETWWTE